MADRSVKVRLTAEIGEYENGMKRAAKAAEDTAQRTARAGQAVDRAAASTAKAGAAADKVGQSFRGTVGDVDKFGQALTQADVVAGRYVDSAGYVREANDDFVAGFKGAATAAEKTGQALKGTVGDVDKFGNALTEADVAMGRYVDASGRVREANGHFAAGFSKAREATEQATESADKAAGTWGRLSAVAMENEAAWSNVSTALLGIGAALLAGPAMAVKTFADYDKAMSSVQSATHATEADMAALGEAAVKAGADTAFSAEEAARGIEELAKAGVSTEAILGGGLDGALSLAAAGALEVGDAAEIAASALTQFKLEGSDVGHIADLLAAGAGKAQGSVHDLGMALNQSGLIASQTGLTIEETTGGLAAFASAGLVGSDAGTSFKTMLQRLNPQTEAAATLMDELGISAYDSEGNFVGLTEWAGRLQEGLSGMSEQQRAAAMQTLFGSDAIRAASVVYEQGAEGIQTWIDNVNDAGYAAETAALMQDNLAGDLEKLGGAFDTVFLQSGSGVNDSLRGMVQGTEAFVDAIGRVPAPILTAGAAITGLAGGGALLAGGLMKGISAVAETKQAMDDLGISADMLPDKLKNVGKAAGVAAGLAVLAKSLIEIADKSAPVAVGLSDIENALAGTPGKLDALNASFANAEWANGNQGGIAGRMHETVEGINSVGDAITNLQNMGGLDKFSDWGNDLLGMEDAWSQARAQIESVDTAIGDLANGGNLEGAATQFRAVMDSVKESGGNVEEAAAGFDTYRAAIQEYATSLGVTLDDQQVFAAMMGEMPPALANAATAAEQTATGIAGIGAEAAGAEGGARQIAAGMGEITDSSGEAVDTLEDLVDALSLLGMIQLDAQAATGAFHEAMRATSEAIGEATGAVRTANGEFDVTTEAGYAAQQAFAGVATSGWDMAEGVANAGGSFSDITGAMQSTYDGLVSTAEQFGFTSEQARALATEALGVPENVDIETFMSNSALQMAQQTGSMVAGVPDQVNISSFMSDAAWREAFRTSAEAAGVPEHVAISAFMEDYARDKASQTTAAVLGIPEGSSVSSWMDANAESQAVRTANAVNNIPRTVTITTYHQNVETWNKSSVGSAAPARSTGVPFKAAGGRLPAYALGGRLPQYGPGTDRRDGIMGISSLTGEPTAWVDKGEWVINGRSSQKYDGLLAAINRDDPRLRGLEAFATGGRVTGRINGLSARPGEENWQWQARQLQIIKSMEYTVGKLADWELYEDGSGWVRTMDGAMVEIADGAYTVTYAAGESARSMGLASQDAKWAAETAKAAGGSFQGAGGAAVTASGSFQYAGVTANATAGTFQVAGQVTQQAAQAILAATAAVNAAGKQRKAATGGGLTARRGEADVVWRGRQSQFEQAISKRYGGVKYSDIYEDGSGQIVLDDGRLIELNNGRWKFVSRFKYGAPAHGRTVSRYANGGRLPSTGLGTDSILGISSAGAPVAWVDDREWVINQRSSDKYNALLGAVNRDDPSVRHLARHATGSRAGSREYTASQAGFAPAATVNVPEIDYGQLAAAMSRVQLSTPPVQIGPRESKRILGQAGINR